MSDTPYLICQDCGGRYLQTGEWQNPELCLDCYERRTMPAPVAEIGQSDSLTRNKKRRRLSAEDIERGIRTCKRCRKHYHISPGWYDPFLCPTCANKPSKQTVPSNDKQEYVGLVTCPRCGGAFYPADDAASGEYCSSCAEQIEEELYMEREANQLPPQAGMTFKEINLFLGKTDGYVRSFKHIADTGQWWSWTWGGFLSYFWLCYRKMYLEAVFFFVLSEILSLIIDFSPLGHLSPKLWWLDLLLGIIPFLPTVVLGDWLYYRHTSRTIASIKQQKSKKDISAALMAAGGTSWPAVFLAIALTVVFAILWNSASTLFKW
jgi:hypothetical protein